MLTAGPDRDNHGYYELRPVHGKDDGAFALKDIPAGTKILADRPLITMIQTSSESINKRTAQNEYNDLTATDKSDFDATPGFHMEGANKGEKNFDAHPFDKLLANNFSNGDDPNQKRFYAYASRFNHSCLPNCEMLENKDGKLECFVLTNVAEDEELTFAYVDDCLYMTYNERQKYARDYFRRCDCLCKLCTGSEEVRRDSDLRRRLMRSLMYTWGEIDIVTKYGEPIQKDNITALLGPKRSGGLEPLRLFIDLAEREGLLTGTWLQWACWQAAVKLYQKTWGVGRSLDVQKELPDFKKWVLLAEHLKTVSGGRGCADENGRSFNADVAKFKSIIAAHEDS